MDADSAPNISQITPFEKEPLELVDDALQVLHSAGYNPIQWGALVYKQMGVPLLITDFSFVLPDADIKPVSDLLEALGLPLSPHVPLLLKADGDIHAKGVLHRITRTATFPGVRFLVLFPSSFASLSLPSVSLSPPHRDYPLRTPSLCPSPSSVYASILRVMLNYPFMCTTRTVLASDLMQLVVYHLLEAECGYVDHILREEIEADNRVEKAIDVVKSWEWDEGEEWFGDVLEAILSEKGDIEWLPWKLDK